MRQIHLITLQVLVQQMTKFSRRTDGSTDSRMSHLGCPVSQIGSKVAVNKSHKMGLVETVFVESENTMKVLFGDKWIGNKWVRWQEQVIFRCSISLKSDLNLISI